MEKAAQWMVREAVRHATASVIAAILTGAVVFVGITWGRLGGGPSLNSLFIALMFGLYGPILLALSWWTFRGFSGEDLRARATRGGERSVFMRWIFLSSPTSWAATVLIIGVISAVLLTTSDARNTIWIVPICIVGVTGTWILMVAVLATEYMRLWARTDAILFPGDESRVFADFVYLSIQMSTTFSSADVQLVRTPVRRLASLHSVLAFAYSTAIIAVFASLLITITS